MAEPVQHVESATRLIPQVDKFLRSSASPDAKQKALSILYDRFKDCPFALGQIDAHFGV